MKREKNSKEFVYILGAFGLWYSLVIAKTGALSVCSFVLLNEMRKEHSCLSLSDLVMEVSGTDVKLAWVPDVFLCSSQSFQRERM